MQEALTNVIKHASSAAATVDVRAHGREIVVRVTDPGNGLDPATTGAGRRAERAAACSGCTSGSGSTAAS